MRYDNFYTFKWVRIVLWIEEHSDRRAQPDDWMSHQVITVVLQSYHPRGNELWI